MNLKSIPEEDRPVERIERQGAGALSDIELLAVILNSGTREKNALELSAGILSDYPVEKLQSISIQQLQKISGVKKMKAARIVAAFEIGRRAKAKKSDFANNAGDVFQILGEEMKALEVEKTKGIYLNSRNKILSIQTITSGTLTASIIHPREIIKNAINANASAVIVVHNHPSGDCTPSLEDIKATKILSTACEVVGIQLLDHVIIGEGYFSFKEKKMI